MNIQTKRDPFIQTALSMQHSADEAAVCMTANSHNQLLLGRSELRTSKQLAVEISDQITHMRGLDTIPLSEFFKLQNLGAAQGLADALEAVQAMNPDKRVGEPEIPEKSSQGAAEAPESANLLVVGGLE